MKFTVLTMFLTMLSVCFGQMTITETGTWCDANLQLTADISDDATILRWKKDGVVLGGETNNTIDCIVYGEGFYEIEIIQEDLVSIITHNLLDGGSADFTAVNYLAAAVTYFEALAIDGETIVAWSWDFGNGETSNLQNPKIMFSEQKTYSITLTVTNSDGCTHTITKTHEWVYE